VQFLGEKGAVRLPTYPAANVLEGLGRDDT
jgi:hypothetical protein